MAHLKTAVFAGRRRVTLWLDDNKLRKLAYYYQRPDSFFEGRTLVSYGGAQSNAMLALARLASAKGVPFTYYCHTLPGVVRARPWQGNFGDALELGMRVEEVSSDLEAAAAKHAEGSGHILIQRGGSMPEASHGVGQLGAEIRTFLDSRKDGDGHDHQQQQQQQPGCATEGKARRSAVVLPAGTGATALFLQQSLWPDVDVVCVPCVGGATYLQSQFEQLALETDARRKQMQAQLTGDECTGSADASCGSGLARAARPWAWPSILSPLKKKRRFGALDSDLLGIFSRLRQAFGVDFDLLYACPAWEALLAAGSDDPRLPEDIIYLHCGGLEGNRTQMGRYRHRGFAVPTEEA